MSDQKPKASSQTWADLEDFGEWAILNDWDDDRMIEVCRLFLEISRIHAKKRSERTVN